MMAQNRPPSHQEILLRAVAVSSFGDPEVLAVIDVATPEPAAGQVRIRVQAAPVHPVDLGTRAGAFAALLPEKPEYFLGWDLAGTIDTVGEGVTGFAPGQAVVGLSDWFGTLVGTQAEYVVLNASAVAPAPTNATPVEAATLPLNALTAAQALDLLNLNAGQSVAITGAAGAVGGYAVELALHRGLKVYAISGAQDEQFLTNLGATFVPRSEDPAAAVRAFVPEGVDGVLDTALVGGPVLGAVKEGGSFVNVYAPLAPEAERDITIGSVFVQSNGAQLAELVGLVEQGKLSLRVAQTFSFAEAAQAHEVLGKGGVRGRIVLVP
jgi:NADPH:quinone reductase-like Zn-dependent oxidoreductase